MARPPNTRSESRSEGRSGGGTQRAELESERNFLLASLSDLESEREAGDLDEAAYRSLHDDYTARAATALRALEASDDRGVETSVAGPLQPVGRRRSSTVTVAVVLALVLAAVGAVVVFAGERRSGQSVTGSLPQGPSGMVGQALALERAGDAVGALKLYDNALRIAPDDPEALAYRGWLLKRAGLVDEALASLDRAVAADPAYPDAHFFRGMVLYQDRKDPNGAVGEFRLFLANDPPLAMVAMVENVLRRAMADAGLPRVDGEWPGGSVPQAPSSETAPG